MGEWTRAVVGLVVGLAVGAYAGWWWRGPDSESVASDLEVAKVTVQVGSPRPLAVANHRPVVDPETPRIAPSPTQNTVTNINETLLIDGDFGQTAALYNLAASVAPEELFDLIDQAEHITQYSERRAATSIIYARLAEIDPQATLDDILRRNNTFARQALSSLFHTWSRRDLQSAMAAAGQLDAADRQIAGLAILNARDDLPSGQIRTLAAELGLQHLAPRMEAQRLVGRVDYDPEGAWQSALEAGPGAKWQLQAVAVAWANRDPQAALAAVAALGSPSQRRRLTQQISARWATRDPQAALDWALAQPTSNVSASAVTQALGALAVARPEYAWQVASGLDERTREGAQVAVLNGWAANDPLTAATRLLEATNPSVRQNSVYSVGQQLAQYDLNEAIIWSERLPENERKQAVMTVMQAAAATQPEVAARRIADYGSAEIRTVASQALLSQWMNLDPDAASDFYFDLNAATRAQLAGDFYPRWANTQPAAAVDAVTDLPAGEPREQAIYGLVANANVEVAAAESLYDELRNPQWTQAAANRLYQRLKQSDPVRAERYRLAAGISNEE